MTPDRTTGRSTGRTGPRTDRDDLRDLGRLRRTTGDNKKIAGVAGGLARHLDVDPLLLRVALVVLVFFGGAGLIVYGACWLLVPSDGDERAPFNFDERTRSVALVIAGVIAGLALIGDTMGGFGFPWPLAVVALVVLIAVSVGDRDRRPRPTAPPVPHTYAPPYGPQTQQGWVTPPPPAGGSGTTYGPPAPGVWQPAPQPHRRKRGPILFFWTAALAALAIGVLGIIDVAGAGVADSAYPALVVGICGVMLLVGAFFGRPGGLIIVGLVAALVMTATTASSRWDDRVVRMPASSAQVQDTYELGAGELILDLSDVADLENLDGRSIDLHVGVGSLEVIIPEGLDVDYDAHVGLGDADVFDQSQEGGGVSMTGTYSGGVGVPELDLDLDIGLGEIKVYVIDDATGATR